MVMKFDPQGRVALLLGRKAEAIQNPPRAGGPAAERRGRRRPRRRLARSGTRSRMSSTVRPTSRGTRQGNIFVADGRGNARVAKFSKDGVFVKSWGQQGTAPGQFASVDSIAVDAQGNVYAADAGNKRIQVFDNDGTFKTRDQERRQRPGASASRPGANQVLYVLELESARRHRHRRRNLQDEARRHR